MAQDENGQEKNYEPSDKKLREAREKGQVPHSQELSTLLVYVSAAVITLGFGATVLREFAGLFTAIMSKAGNIAGPSDGPGLSDAVGSFLSELGWILLPIGVLFVLSALLPSVIQGTVVLAPEKIKPKASNISPKSGVKKIVGAKNLIEFTKGLVVIAVITTAVGITLGSYLDSSAVLVRSPFLASRQLMAEALAYLIGAMIFVQMIVTVADIFFQRFEHQRQNRMSHKEIQEEQKQTEGDPEVKKKLSQMRQEKGQQRMMQDVPESDLVVANPTHYAVALKYRRGQDEAPRCIAKGADYVALRIREKANEHDIPIVEDPGLAQGLYNAVDLDETIPENFYRAVAAVMRYVGVVGNGDESTGKRSR